MAGFDVYNPVTLITNTAADNYSIPTAFDWNYDGNWDLLVGEWGSDNVGHVRLFGNNGTNAAPNFSFVSNVSAGGSVIALGVG